MGLEYQLLAGPVFILVFTIVGVVLGIAADKYNRSKMLFVCTLVFGVAIVLQGEFAYLNFLTSILVKNSLFRFGADILAVDRSSYDHGGG